LSIIKEDSLVRGEKKEKRLSVLFDSGSARSLIRSDVAEELTTPRDLPAPIGVTVADGHEVGVQVLLQLSGRGRGQRGGNPTPFGRRLARPPNLRSLGDGGLHDQTRLGQKEAGLIRVHGTHVGLVISPDVKSLPTFCFVRNAMIKLKNDLVLTGTSFIDVEEVV